MSFSNRIALHDHDVGAEFNHLTLLCLKLALYTIKAGDFKVFLHCYVGLLFEPDNIIDQCVTLISLAWNTPTDLGVYNSVHLYTGRQCIKCCGSLDSLYHSTSQLVLWLNKVLSHSQSSKIDFFKPNQEFRRKLNYAMIFVIWLCFSLLSK